MNTIHYILKYAIYGALMRGVRNKMDEINAKAREDDSFAPLEASLYHAEHPLAKLWRQANKEQLDLTRSYKER